MLQVHGLSKKFGGIRANDNLSLTVTAGEIMGLIGPNGAGKSTLFDVLTGYQRADAGEAIFDGRSIVGLRPDQINRLGIGRTFQRMKPFAKMSVVENVMVGVMQHTAKPGRARHQALEILDSVGLLEKRAAFADMLSTGQRKRLELARAIATYPRLLLLDEVTGGVDMGSIAGLVELVKQLNRQGITLIIIEHNMQVLMSLAERVVALHLGRKIAEGTPAAVQNNQAVIDAYLGIADA